MQANASLAVGGVASIREVTRRESELRLRYIDLPDQQPNHGKGLSSEEITELLEGSAALLELTLVTACFAEAADRAEIKTTGGMLEQASILLEETRLISGFDPIKVTMEHMPGGGDTRVGDADAPLKPFERIVDLVKALVSACPISVLEHRASRAGLESQAHRCRVAYDGLIALLRRTDPETKTRIHAVGRKYAQGAISIREVAEILGVVVPDAVAVLETHGYARSLETISLKPDEKRDVLLALRADRERRKSNQTFATFAPARAARHAIASERIENVDARSWIAVE